MTRKRIVIFTGSEIRHKYLVNEFINDERFEVVMAYCESAEKGLLNKVLTSSQSSELEKSHVLQRLESEKNYLSNYDESLFQTANNVKFIPKGSINEAETIEEIVGLEPDILVAYGCSIIKGELLEFFAGRFLNVHLGLSPYYRGGGTNMWPIVNKEPQYIGATFMYIDSGIDTGEVIHQIRANYQAEDTIHDVGNRLIIQMTKVYKELVTKFDVLTREPQIVSEGKLYLAKDFTADTCEVLYKNIEEGIFSKENDEQPVIVENKGLWS
jgi:methionyl-tRNA formyltransferase